jgi:hypothetical protein
MNTVSTTLGYLTTDVTVVLNDNLSLVIQIIISYFIVPLVEQELLTLPENMSSLSDVCGVRVVPYK